MRFVYVDESTFSEPNACIGTGMLITDLEIMQELIDEALFNLKKDPDRLKMPCKKLDDRTLKEGYFHASEDSKNAHSHLVDAINKYINGEFITDFSNPNMESPFKINYHTYDSSFLNNTIYVLQTKNEIKFLIENRTGLNEKELILNHRKLEKNIILNVYNQVLIPRYFPKVSFQIVDKYTPGVQCCDLLLWTINKKHNGDKTWYDRIKFKSKSSHSTDTKSWGGECICIQKGLTNIKFSYKQGLILKDTDSYINNNMLIEFFLTAVKTIDFYFNNPNPNIIHFQEDINKLYHQKFSINAKDYLKNLCTLYIKIFDMVDLINKNVSDKDARFLLLSKKYLALILHNELFHGVRTNFWLRRVRREIISQQKNILEFKN